MTNREILLVQIIELQKNHTRELMNLVVANNNNLTTKLEAIMKDIKKEK